MLGKLDDRHLVLADRMASRRNRTGSSSFRSGPAAGRCPREERLVDGGAEGRTRLGGESRPAGRPRCRYPGRPWSAWPGIRVPVRESRSTEHRQSRGPERWSPSLMAWAAAPRPLPNGPRRATAAGESQKGCAQAVRVVDRLEVEPALVAQPTPVHRVDVDAVEPKHPITGPVDQDPATNRAHCRSTPPPRDPTVGPGIGRASQ